MVEQELAPDTGRAEVLRGSPCLAERVDEQQPEAACGFGVRWQHPRPVACRPGWDGYRCGCRSHGLRRSTRCTRPGWASMLEPIMKKVAGTCFSFRISRIAGVHSGSGPSSKVSASLLGQAAHSADDIAGGQAVIALVHNVAGRGLDRARAARAHRRTRLLRAGSRPCRRNRHLRIIGNVPQAVGRGRIIGPAHQRQDGRILRAQPPQRIAGGLIGDRRHGSG